MKCVVVVSALIYAVCGAAVPESKIPQELTWNILLNDRQLSKQIEIAQGTENLSRDGFVLRIPRNAIETDTEDEEQDVYWRPWMGHGKMPADAVIGGYTTSECGSKVPIFLAQVYVKTTKAGLQPTQIFKNSRSVKPTYGGTQHETNDNIKILCVENQSILAWIPINQTQHLEAAKDCVIGGAEADSNMFFGRTLRDGEMIIGKASIKHKNMHYADIGKEVFTNSNFDVLCYRRALNKIAGAEKKTEAEKKN